MGIFEPGTKESFDTEAQEKVDEPAFYKVLLHNDDYTTMEFVIEVLRFVFHKSNQESTKIMLSVHHNGIGYCGTYPYEVAETKVDTVHALAKQRGFPLKCTMERD